MTSQCVRPSVFGRHSAHEQVVYCRDEASGLQAIIAIYSTALGPALGGTRFYPYASEADALDDVLNLARAMAYKAAITGLDLGGGKAVISATHARQERGAAAGVRPVRAVARRALHHRVRRRHLPAGHGRRRARDAYVTGRSVEGGGAGDSAVLTAYGVFPGHARVRRAPVGRTNARWPARWRGRRRQGGLSAGLAPDRGWRLGRRHRCEAGGGRPGAVGLPQVSVVHDAAALVRTPHLDIYAPCALGGASTTHGAPVGADSCRAANNQLAHGGIEKVLEDRGILYAPDYVVNAGGLIQVADEVDGFSERRARARATSIYDTTRRSSAWPRRACPRRWPRIGLLSDEWPRSVGSVGFGSPAVAQPQGEVGFQCEAMVGSFGGAGYGEGV